MLHYTDLQDSCSDASRISPPARSERHRASSGPDLPRLFLFLDHLEFWHIRQANPVRIVLNLHKDCVRTQGSDTALLDVVTQDQKQKLQLRHPSLAPSAIVRYLEAKDQSSLLGTCEREKLLRGCDAVDLEGVAAKVYRACFVLDPAAYFEEAMSCSLRGSLSTNFDPLVCRKYEMVDCVPQFCGEIEEGGRLL